MGERSGWLNPWSSAATACAILVVATLTGCASPAPKGGSAAGDRDAMYKVENRPDGFTISTTYSRYQFIPESQAVQAACKQGLMATAHDYAESFQRKIEPINEQRIRISMGRNGFTGITSCEASVPAVWAK